ncbi:MAG: ketoacyl-ACP synthase III [Ignavibacteriae bacterium]|nr:ketoacyl-ACP synthase III [Ignavibacteriota bacterium]
MKVSISGISYYLPLNVLSNEEINDNFPEWSVEKIAEKTGITNRHISGTSEFSSDMAVQSSLKLFEEYNINPIDIDYLILCTQSPDYFLPTTACLLQNRLGLRTSAGAIDFNLGCSGFVYGLSLAKGLILTEDVKNVLLITSETYSKFINHKDKSVKTIFGDASASTLITCEGSNDIKQFIFGTDGRGANNLIVKNGGMRYMKNTDEEGVVDANGNPKFNNNLYMNGAEIFSFTLKTVPKLVKDLLIKNDLMIEDIDLFIFHQANKFMLETLRKKLNIPENKFFYFLEDVGNTVSSTIPIAMKEAFKNNIIKENSKVMIIGFGVGYSWAGNIIQF